MRFLLEFWEGLKIAVSAIRAQKLRALLTTLGIVIGIVSVTSMFTTITGVERAFDASVAMLGNDILHVQRLSWNTPPQEWWRFRNRPLVGEDEAEAIEARSKYAIAVAPVAQSGRSASYKDRSLSGVFIQASTPAFSLTRDVSIKEGRFYNEDDTRASRNVCVLGKEVAETLFPAERALGKTIRIGNDPFEVIGVLAEQGKFLGLFSFDSQIQMPFSTFKKLYGTRFRDLDVQVKIPAEFAAEAEDEITGILRSVRGVDAMEENNFSINKQEAFRASFDSIKVVIYGVGLFLTALSLIVGGIGVMNIMFVSVKERTKEIGIRKAVGATRGAILTQFLIEAISVCVVGGLIGILFSIGVTALINQFFVAVLSAGAVFLAFGICVGVGVVFGFIPAWSAARADPIESLRYE